MSRFDKWLRKLAHSSFSAASPLYIDMGSSSTRVLMDGKLVYSESTCIAIHKESGEVVAVGKKAEQLLGKTPQSIEVIFPVRTGKVVHLHPAQQYVKALVGQLAFSHYSFPIVSQPGIFALPSFATPIQKEMRKKIWYSAHVSLSFESKAHCLMRRVQQLKNMLSVNFVIDIGGMTTEIGVWSENQLVRELTLPYGSEHLTQEIILRVRKEYHCEIGWKTAELIKKEIVQIKDKKGSPKQMVIRGRDTLSSLPTTIQISSEHFQEIATNIAQEIATGFQKVCQDISPELLASSLGEGIFLTGGGAFIGGIKEFLQDRLKTEIILSATPFEDVIRGL
jgi:rod shape-determining protein MreB